MRFDDFFFELCMLFEIANIKCAFSAELRFKKNREMIVRFISVTAHSAGPETEIDIIDIFFSFICRSAKGIMHMRIKRDASSRQFQLSDFSRTFLTIPDMVYHYTRYNQFLLLIFLIIIFLILI